MTGLQWTSAWTRQEGAQRARTLFARTFADDHDGVTVAAEPDGVWSAPGRVNLIGEHTDYNAGLCLPVALPHRTYVALRRRPDNVVRIASAQTEDPWQIHLTDVASGAAGWGAFVAGVAWALREAGHNVGGFDAVIDSCVPFGASLSSSAALECACAVALDDAFELGLSRDRAGRLALVAACIRAENEIAGAATGGLDQSASMFCRAGEALLLDFRPELTPEERAIDVPFDLGGQGLTLLVVDTSAPHQLVDGQYADRRAACEEAAKILGVDNLRQIEPTSLDDALRTLADHDGGGILARRLRHVVTETGRTADFAELVRAGRYDEVGTLMNASHTSLRDDYEVTVAETDLSVRASLDAGAIGARMTGGGFGGSTIALVRSDAVDVVAEAIRAAFDDAGFTAPVFLTSPPSSPAGRDA